MRIGLGFDAHRFVKGRTLFLGGIKIPYEKGLLGHSDADVLIHAIIDALLGAASLGNIGRYFPDTDPAYKDISSVILLEKTIAILAENEYEIVNLDTVLILEEPRLDKYWEPMSETLCTIMKIETDQLSLKAKTTEKMGFTGKKEGIAAMANVLIKKS